MKFSAALSVLSALVVLVTAQDNSIAAVKAAFRSANIPRDLDVTFEPTALLEVTFPQSSGREVPVHAGIHLPRNETVGPPRFAVRGTFNPRDVFVVSTVDPDAPTPQDPTAAQIRHFLAPNFVQRGAILSETKELVNLTAPISHWLQPTPPAGSDAHRYVFLLWHQPAGFNDQTLVNVTTPINNFNISTFAKATKLGNPVAGTFILVAPDPSP